MTSGLERIFRRSLTISKRKHNKVTTQKDIDIAWANFDYVMSSQFEVDLDFQGMSL